MKKLVASLILGISLCITAQAAIGIPEELQPQNAALKNLNRVIEQEVSNAEKTEKGQQGAVSAVNIAIQYIANILLYFAAPLAVLFIARAGADYAFAMGEENKMEGAKRQLTWSLLGLALIIFSYILVRLFIQPFPFLQDATDANPAIQKSVTTDQAKDKAKKEAEEGAAMREKYIKDMEQVKKEAQEENEKEEQEAAKKATDAKTKAKQEDKTYQEAMQKEANKAATENQSLIQTLKFQAGQEESKANKLLKEAENAQKLADNARATRMHIEEKLLKESQKPNPNKKLLKQYDMKARKADQDEYAFQLQADSAKTKGIESEKKAIEMKDRIESYSTEQPS